MVVASENPLTGEPAAAGSVPGSVAVAACAFMALFYVAILYSPTLILRLPPPSSLDSFMIRRFACAILSSAVSVLASAILLGLGRFQDLPSVLGVFGIRKDHLAPFTEELVFRACMIPLLLCAGYKTYSIIFLSPVFFSLAHLNHFMELYFQQKYSFLKAFLIVGNLLSPIVAHIFCNAMGLPTLSSSRTKGAATVAFVAGLAGFCWLLFPASSPDLYNNRRDGCSCWHGYCSWN